MQCVSLGARVDPAHEHCVLTSAQHTPHWSGLHPTSCDPCSGFLGTVGDYHGDDIPRCRCYNNMHYTHGNTTEALRAHAGESHSTGD